MDMSFLEFALFCAAAYLAIVTLVRMMRRQRDALIDQLTQEAEAEKRRLRKEAQTELRRKLQEKMKQEAAKNRHAA